MRRICPSIQELQAFDAVARHLNMTHAAEELCVTQGAVSKHILRLEEWLGVRLFERVKQRLVLTPPAKTYLALIRPSLAALEAASLKLRTAGQDQATLQLACVPTFCAKWLLPRLPTFLQTHPEVKISFTPFSSAFGQGPADDALVTIRYGEGVWAHTCADYLTGRNLLLVGAPQIAGQIRDPQDLKHCGLLHHTSLPHVWENWRRANGDLPMNAYAGMRFEQFSLLIEAAVAGLGVALVPACLIQPEIADGRLATVSNSTIDGWKGYYLCYPPDMQHRHDLAALRDWMLEQVAAA
ncbi:MAG: transcriptional regulator GcvA [Rhodoferax sp.]